MPETPELVGDLISGLGALLLRHPGAAPARHLEPAVLLRRNTIAPQQRSSHVGRLRKRDLADRLQRRCIPPQVRLLADVAIVNIGFELRPKTFQLRSWCIEEHDTRVRVFRNEADVALDVGQRVGFNPESWLRENRYDLALRGLVPLRWWPCRHGPSYVVELLKNPLPLLLGISGGECDLTFTAPCRRPEQTRPGDPPANERKNSVCHGPVLYYGDGTVVRLTVCAKAARRSSGARSSRPSSAIVRMASSQALATSA